jgi:AmiR/NasT family two-component response regulator
LFTTGVLLSKENPNPKRDPLQQSVTSLALFAMYAAGAGGYGLFELDQANGALSLRDANGLEMPQWSDPAGQSGIQSRDGITVALFPLYVEATVAGSLAFVFLGYQIPEEKLLILSRMAAIIEAVHALPHTTAGLAARIGTLDAELAGIKIAERTRGILAAGMPEQEAIETLASHVTRVLEGRQFGSVLEQLLPHLEEQLASRQVVVRAKSLLEARHGMSEEQAYIHLRVKSRSSRRRLSEVAQELLAVETSARQEERR